jgi:PAS domain-containing protein
MQGPGDLSSEQIIRDLKTLRRKVGELEVVNAALRRSVESLLNRESRCAIALAAARAGIWELDLECGRVFLDPSLGQMLGFDTDDTGMDVNQVSMLLPEPEAERLRSARNRLMNGETDCIQLEFQVESGTTGPRRLAIYGSLALNGNGQPARLVGICRDVTCVDGPSEGSEEPQS